MEHSHRTGSKTENIRCAVKLRTLPIHITLAQKHPHAAYKTAQLNASAPCRALSKHQGALGKQQGVLIAIVYRRLVRVRPI